MTFYRVRDVPLESSSAPSSSSDSSVDVNPSANGPGRPVLQAQRVISSSVSRDVGVDIQCRNICGVVIVRQTRAMVEHIPNIIRIVTRRDRCWDGDRDGSK